MTTKSATAWHVARDGADARVVVAQDWWTALGQALRDDGVADSVSKVSARVVASGVVARVDDHTWTLRPHAEPEADADVADPLRSACRRALQAAMERAPSESAAVLLLEGAFLRFVEAIGPHGDTLHGIRIPATSGIAGHALRTQRAQVVGEADGLLRHNDTIDHLTGYRSRQILAVPMLHGGTAQGVLELINPTDDRRFGPAEARSVGLVAQVLSAWLARHPR